MKSVAKDLPALRCLSVDLSSEEEPAALAHKLVADPLPGPELVIGPGSVVVVTEARAITARVAVTLAEKYRCRLELVGRAGLPDPEDDVLAACADAPTLRRLLVDRGMRSPAQIEAEAGRILASREIRATIAACERAGAQVSYHACDARDDEAFGAVIDEIYDRQGRIDGVIHGAGVIEDKTKVRGAITLAEKLRSDVRFIVFFSSLSGAFGSRGQGNDALDKLVLHLSRCMLGRVVSINWGAGLVNPERDIGAISAEEGVTRFLDELGRGESAQVVFLPDSAEAFEV